MNSPALAIAAFERSISALAQVALRETRATGYALFARTPEAPGLLRFASAGELIAAEALPNQQGIRPLTIFPLHTKGVPDGFLAFAFADPGTAMRAKTTLARLQEAIEIIWAARHFDESYRDLAVRASTLEARLIDSRIADRALGLLADGPRVDLVEALVAHVKNVLRPSEVRGSIEALVQQLEDEIEERRATAEAKAILQAAHSFSEEQAYTHLRVLSRKSRRRLKDVALDVIANRAFAASAA